MCLISLNPEGKIARKNICVVKTLIQGRYGLITPYIGAPANLDTYLIPKELKPSIKQEGDICTIESGVIHSFSSYLPVTKLTITSMEYYAFIGIIPKGTKYWENKFYLEMCSETLLITSISAKTASSLTKMEIDFNNSKSELYKKYKDLLENPKYNK